MSSATTRATAFVGPCVHKASERMSTMTLGRDLGSFQCPMLMLISTLCRTHSYPGTPDGRITNTHGAVPSASRSTPGASPSAALASALSWANLVNAASFCQDTLIASDSESMPQASTRGATSGVVFTLEGGLIVTCPPDPDWPGELPGALPGVQHQRTRVLPPLPPSRRGPPAPASLRRLAS